MSDWMMPIVSFIYAAILAGTPLLFGTLGEIVTQKSGHLNLGVEGMMYLGAIFGFLAGFHTDSAALTVLAAMAAGAGGALIYAFLTVTLRANQNVTGLTLTIFGAGLANLIGDYMTSSNAAGVFVLSENVKGAFRALPWGGLSDAPVVGRLLFQYNPFVYFGVALAIALGLYMHHTRYGRNLRAVGENPGAADAASVNVSLYKYIHIAVGGAICGLGGAYVAVVTCGGVWVYNIISGQGWIAVALVIFAGWSTYRALLGSLVFGSLSILRLYIPSSVAQIPTAIFSMLPFLATAAVLVFTSARPGNKRLQPKGCGVNYYREER